MPVTAKWYGQAVIKAFNKEVKWETDTIKVLLCTSAYAPNQDAHVYKNQITNEVANGNGYATGGVILANKTSAYDGATNTVKFDADDIVWLAASVTARYAVIYVDTGNSATSVLLGYVDFDKDVVSTDGDFRIVWNALGILSATVG